VTLPELPSLAPKTGALESVMVVSPQVVSATGYASVAGRLGAVGPYPQRGVGHGSGQAVTLKRRYERTTGEPSTRIWVSVPWLTVGAEAST